MSISADRLRALRKQAGDATVRVVPAATTASTLATSRPVNGVQGGSPPPQPSPSLREREGASGLVMCDASPAVAPSLCAARGGTGWGAPAVPDPTATDTGTLAQPPRARPAFDWTDASSTLPANDSPRSCLQPRNIDALRKLIATRERKPGTPSLPTRRAASLDRTLPGRELAPGLHLIEAFLPQPIPRAPLPLAFAKRHDEAVHPRDLLFFDTETTGLAGGTGTRAFMIGAADWHVDAHGVEGVRVRQLMLSTLAAEAAMLRAFAQWLAPSTVLSSYNGRCYDAPLLKTRYRLARQTEPLSALDHVDLLFPTRRRYRGTWENCRLATIERQLLRIVREDDLPGAEAPAAWLSFLRGGSARNLRRVAEHNHQDVVTLALLFQRLVQAEEEDRTVLALGAMP